MLPEHQLYFLCIWPPLCQVHLCFFLQKLHCIQVWTTKELFLYQYLNFHLNTPKVTIIKIKLLDLNKVSEKNPSKYNKIDNHYVKTDSFSNYPILLIYFSLFVGISPFSREGRVGHTYHIPSSLTGYPTSTEILTCLDLSHFPEVRASNYGIFIIMIVNSKKIPSTVCDLISLGFELTTPRGRHVRHRSR